MNTQTELQALLSKDIVYKLKASLDILLSNTAELLRKGWRFAYEEPKTLRQTAEVIFDFVQNLPGRVGLSDGDLETAAARLVKCKESLFDIRHALQMYESQLNYLAFLARGADTALYYGAAEPPEMDVARIMADCAQFLEDAGNSKLENLRKSKLMSCFPMRMTKDRFFDYVRDSARILLDFSVGADPDDGKIKGFIDEYVQFLKIMFKPDKAIGYGRFFPKAAEQIAECSSLSFDGLNGGALEAVREKLSALSDEFVIIHDHLLLLFECVNSLLILTRYAADFDGLFENDFAYRDAYGALRENMVPSEDAEPILEKVTDMFYAQLDKRIDDIAASNKRCEQALSRTAFDTLPDGVLDTLQIRTEVSALFYENLDEVSIRHGKPPYASPAEDTPDDIRAYILARIDGIIAYIRECLASETPRSGKLLRQHFLNFLLCPYSNDKLIAHMADAFDACANSAQVAHIAANIAHVFSDAGYTFEDNDMLEFLDEGPEHHHIHNEHCGCAHDNNGS